MSKDHVKSSTKGLFVITSHVDFELLYFSKFYRKLRSKTKKKEITIVVRTNVPDRL